jgi:copper homeostasis protein
MSESISRRVLLEVCVASVDDAIAAESAGADRLELNSALMMGGLTPSMGTLAEVKRLVKLPVMAMIRPRAGGFCYSDADFQVMLRDIDFALEHGAAGIVFGVLRDDGQVDIPRCTELVRRIGPAEAVFHRAFDVTPNAHRSLSQLIELGIKRVMTSGQQESAHVGAGLIAELIKRSAGRIEILPAGGINSSNVTALLEQSGCDQIHASLRGPRRDASTAVRPNIKFGGPRMPAEQGYEATDAEAVKEMVAMLHR